MINYKQTVTAWLLIAVLAAGAAACEDVVIVGSGYAGVAAAREIEKQNKASGADVSYVILEADSEYDDTAKRLVPRTGGRARRSTGLLVQKAIFCLNSFGRTWKALN